MLFFLFYPLTTTLFAGDVFIDDGLSYTISDNTYQSDGIWLDSNIANIPGSHINLIEGGRVSSITACNNSNVTNSGGSGSLWAYDNAAISISAGYGMDIFADDNATVNMSGVCMIFFLFTVSQMEPFRRLDLLRLRCL